MENVLAASPAEKAYLEFIQAHATKNATKNPWWNLALHLTEDFQLGLIRASKARSSRGARRAVRKFVMARYAAIQAAGPVVELLALPAPTPSDEEISTDEAIEIMVSEGGPVAIAA